jgi:hypothetical protein
LTRWDPFFQIRRARHLANRRFAGYTADERRDWSVPLDIVRDGDIVKASLAGVPSEDIDATVEGSMLSIKADTKVEEEREDGSYVVREHPARSFHRSLLPIALSSSEYKNQVVVGRQVSGGLFESLILFDGNLYVVHVLGRVNLPSLDERSPAFQALLGRQVVWHVLFHGCRGRVFEMVVPVERDLLHLQDNRTDVLDVCDPAVDFGP